MRFRVKPLNRISFQARSLTSDSALASFGIPNDAYRADPSEFVNSLRQFLSGSRVSGGKIEALGESIASAADGAIQWDAVMTDLERLAEVDPENEGNALRPETPSLSAAGLTAGEIDRLARSLKPDQWLALTLIPIPSVPVFEYRARENE